MRTYRVHVHDHLDQGRWLAQRDYTGRRPSSDTITADLEVLQKPGRYEVRVNRVEGGEEYGLSSWLQGQPVGKIRYARVSTRRDSAEGIERYLPANYRVIYEHGEHVIVAGEDYAGWTMDDYVIPRLGSGLIGAQEINSDYAYAILPRPTEADLDAGWEAAYHIADVGASNPKGVEHTVRNLVRDKHIPLDHVIVRAIEGHLDYLHGNGLGPELDDLREVQANAKRLGITDEAGRYVPAGERRPVVAVCGDCGDDLTGDRDSLEHLDGMPICGGRDAAGSRHPEKFAWDSYDHAARIAQAWGARTGGSGEIVEQDGSWYVRNLRLPEDCCEECG